MKKMINQILILLGSFLILIIGVSFILYNSNPSEKPVYKATNKFICGNASSFSEIQQIGKEIFNINCASCHKLYKKSIGPALSEKDSTVFWNWMTKENNIIDTSKVSKWGIDYHRYFWADSLNSNELNGLYKYINAK